MRSAAKIGIIGFLVILVLIVYVYELQRRDRVAKETGTATETGSDDTGVDMAWPDSSGTGTSAAAETATGTAVDTSGATGTATGTAASSETATTTATATETATPPIPPQPPEEPQEPPREGRTYVTVKNDNLYSISRRFYGSSSHYLKIFNANKDVLKTPDDVPVGVTLVIPPIEGVEPAPPAEEYEIYIVKDGDVLESIARERLGDARLWRKIYTLNRDVIKDPDRIRVGMKIRIPKR